MNLYVHHDNQQVGPFPEESVREMVRVGSVPETALVWHEGAPDWVPLSTFLEQRGPGVQTRALAQRAALGRAAMKSAGSVPSDASLFLRTLGASLGVAVLAGIGWAVFQSFTRIQLPYIFGVGIGWLCGYTVDKVSRGMAGGLFLALAIGSCLLAWVIGVFGVAFAGLAPRIGILTLACFVLALGMAWKTASE